MNTLRTYFLMCFLLASSQVIHAVPSPGYVIEWGWNTSTGKAAPAKQVLDNAAAVRAGRLHCLSLKSDGTVVTWGGNFRGEASFDDSLMKIGSNDHGENTNQIRSDANGVIEIDGQILKDVGSIAVGDGFGLGLKRNGTVITWGENYVPARLMNVREIAAAGLTSFALRNDGTVVEWVSQRSLPQFGELIEVPNLRNVSAIAVGSTYQGTRNVALKSDGTVVRWGGGAAYDNETPPTGLSNVVAIAVGKNHTLAVKSDGTVIGWGFNEVGQATGIPTTNSPPISAGQVMIDGKVLERVLKMAKGKHK